MSPEMLARSWDCRGVAGAKGLLHTDPLSICVSGQTLRKGQQTKKKKSIYKKFKKSGK